jgi:formate-dependent nitrite reductase membrane component NrfD
MMWMNVPVALLVSVYTAFLFAQAKGRDFWQSKLLPLHMLVQSIMAGAAMLIILRSMDLFSMTFPLTLELVLIYTIPVNVLLLLAEVLMKHKSQDAQSVATMIVRGRYAWMFWAGTLISGNLIPFALTGFTPLGIAHAIAAILLIAGIYMAEKIWVEAPQRIPLT